MIVAYRIQLAVPLADAEAAQAVADICCPGVWALWPAPGAVRALPVDPDTPTHAVGSGRVDAAAYAVLAAHALSVGLSHLPVSQWEDDEGVETEVTLDGVGDLWDAMGLVEVGHIDED